MISVDTRLYSQKQQQKQTLTFIDNLVIYYSIISQILQKVLNKVLELLDGI